AVGRGGAATLATRLIDDARLPHRARAGDGAFAAIARAGAGGEVAGRFRAPRFEPVPVGAGERAIATDQSNDSVVVDDAALVKLYPLITPGPHPAVRIPAHLREVGFEGSPRLLGALTWS